MSDFDARYAEPELAYGDQPNEFLASVAALIPDGPVLCLAEGQGRNAVFLAGRGHAVTAVDRSAVGLARASALAAERRVAVTTQVADLAELAIEPGAWAGIVSIFGHLPQPLRSRVHRAAARGLRPGGVFVLEAYRPAQLTFGTGGPRDVAMLPTLDELQADLEGLELEIGREIERDVIEGRFHTGRAAVVQIVARRGRSG